MKKNSLTYNYYFIRINMIINIFRGSLKVGFLTIQAGDPGSIPGL